MRKWKALAGVGATLVAASAVSLAAAASLNLTSPVLPSQMAAAKCSTQTAVVTFEDGRASVQVPEGCEEEELNLHLHTGSGTSAVPIPPNHTQVEAPGEPDGALITADTWPLRTEWTRDEDPEEPEMGDEPFKCELASGGECEVKNIQVTGWPPPVWDTYNVVGTVTTNVQEGEGWRVTMNLSSPEFPFLANEVRDVKGSMLQHVSDSGCSAQPRTLTFEGRDWGENVSQSSTQTFQIWGIIPGSDTGTGVLMYCP